MLVDRFSPRHRSLVYRHRFHHQRDKSLCFNCDSKFTPGHKCSPTMFLYLMVEPEDPVYLFLYLMVKPEDLV